MKESIDMKISILTSDLSQNCLVRPYLLAKILQKHYEVEIVGPIFGEGIWAPVASDKSIKYRYIKINGKFNRYVQILNLVKEIDGDVIYASKPRFASFGVGLLTKLIKGKPLILDIEDWDMGIIKEDILGRRFTRKIKYMILSIFFFYANNSYWNNLIFEKFVHFADEITVSNKFLKEKFGGTIIYHGRDTESLNPKKFDKKTMREKYNIGLDRKIVIFSEYLDTVKYLEPILRKHYGYVQATLYLKDPS